MTSHGVRVAVLLHTTTSHYTVHVAVPMSHRCFFVSMIYIDAADQLGFSYSVTNDLSVRHLMPHYNRCICNLDIIC